MAREIRLLEFAKLASTNSYIKENFELLRERCPLAVMSLEQEAGRGRGDHRWLSSKGKGLYLSILDAVQPGAAQLIALRGALAAAAALNLIFRSAYDLKWPNDILSGGKKIAGILTENIFFRDECFSVLGVGLNLNHTPEDLGPELQQKATSLRILSGKEYLPREAARVLLASYAHVRDQLADAEVIVKANELAGVFRGRRVTLLGGEGKVAGVFLGIGPRGGLLLRGREEIYHAEDVRFDS
jgi:BirA family biotin operon repressor/biotin-[acetyl-CoA-carboxylase] ligase